MTSQCYLVLNGIINTMSFLFLNLHYIFWLVCIVQKYKMHSLSIVKFCNSHCRFLYLSFPSPNFIEFKWFQ